MTSRWIRPKRSTFWALALVCGLVQSRAQEFRVSNAEIDSRGQLTVLYPSTTDSYYLLYRGDTLTNILAVAALGLGQDGSGLLSDSATIDGASQAYYRVRQVPLAQSLDVDGDALPDVYELQRSAYLNPLNPADAALDYDGDGKSNLQEFRDGTNPAELPVDPGAVAPPVNPGGPASLADATSFLYSGPNPIQTGVTNGTFDLLRICVLRGKVRQRDGAPLTGVTISVLGQPEYGRTKTRADGMFDFVVNGGGSFTVKYERPGFCPIQRQITTPWNDYVCLPDAVMITMDPVVTPVTMGTNSPIQVAQSSVQADADGARRATVIFPPGTCANLIVNGQTQSCNSLSVRATEFTVGTNGPATMPAALPPSSAYTYCVELSADEADAAGASTVQFTQPLCLYLENFLNFPVGQAVPMGYYDRLKGVWVAAPNGRVIKVLSETGGLAVLDTDGDGNGDSPAQLAALGITDEERQKIAQLYSPLQTLWRACVTHFTPWDCNWPGGPPPGAQSPSGPSPSPNPDNSCSAGGSIIEVERQALGEMVDIVGTPFQLHYRSDRVFGNQAAYTIQIPLSEETLPPNLKRITLTIDVAGRAFTQEFPPTPGQNFNFTWDGFDAYGRFVPRTQPIKVRIGYVYKAVYYSPGEFEQAFAGFTDDIVTANSGRGEVTLWRNWNGLIGNLLIQSLGLGGWTFDVLHRYDSQSRTLHLGGGGRRSANGLDVTIITRFAGGGSAPGASIGDGGAATNAELAVPSGLAVGPDGSVYIAEQNGARVRKVSPAGIISTIAGSTNGQFCLTATNACGDGGPATEAFLNAPQGVAVALDGTVYIADRGTSRVRKVDTNGIITTVAGTGAFGFSGDGGPAVLAQISSPYGVALGPDGSLYIADYGNRRVRRVSADGIITTVAGGMIVPGPEIGDGGPATRAEIGQPWRVAFDADGNMYIVDRGFYRIRRVGIDGIITTIAGAGGTGGYGGDGGPAALALFGQVEDIAVAPDGSFYIADRSNARVRLVGTEGIITTFAGNGSFGSSGDGGPATQARLSEPNGLALGPDGSLYEADWFNQRVRKISSALPGFSNGDLIIPSADGAEIYVFNNAGRHLRTLDAFTRALRYQFSYDPQWRLTAVEDGDHNVTTVERDANGDATAIVSPYGQRTPLTLTANGYLASIANPASERFSFEYTASGLMTTMTNPRTNTWRFFYDTLGRLIEDRDPAGGFKALARTEGARRFSVELRTAMQQTNRYEVIDLPAGGRRRITTFPTGLQSELWEGTDGTRTNRFPEGVVVSEVMAPDPRFGMLASFPRTNITIFPGGPTNTVAVSRTVTLADPSDPLSLIRWTETNTLNGRSYVSTFVAATKTETNTTPAGRRVVTTYDSQMRPVREEIGGLAPTRYTYDPRGRLASVVRGTDPTARTNLYFYDASGDLTNMVDALGRSTALEYDLAGRLTRATLPNNRVIQNAYDANGNLAGVSPPDRPIHSFSYSPVDRPTGYAPPVAFPGTNSTRYDFDADRQLVQIIRPDGLSTGFDRIGNGCYCDRLNSLVHPRGTNVYHYDPLTGNLSMLTTPDGINLSFTYSGGLMSQEALAGPVSGSVTYDFDSDLDVASRRLNSGAAIANSYDADKLLSGAGNLTIARNPQNGLISGTALGDVTDAWNYNEFAEPTNYSAAFGATPLYAVQFTRDTIGRITGRMETVGTVTSDYTYTYDPAGRLTRVALNGVTNAVCDYDSNDNRLSVVSDGTTRNGAYDDQDRLLSHGVATYTWTANGDLDTKSAGGQITRYNYDVFGNLLRIVLPTGTTIEYLVDGLDRRVGKRVNGALTQGFLYESALRPVAELDGAGNMVSEFVYATRENVPEYLIKGGQTYRIVCDHLGSPRLVVNVANGQIAQRMDYDAFGRVLSDTGPGFQPFGFAGGLYDHDTGLVRLGARDYDAETGRWTAKDPILFAGGQANLYAYVNNDPVNGFDPDGQQGRGGKSGGGGGKGGGGKGGQGGNGGKNGGGTCQVWVGKVTRIPDIEVSVGDITYLPPDPVLEVEVGPIERVPDFDELLMEFKMGHPR